MNPVAVVFWTFLLGVSGLALASVLLARRRARTWPRTTARLVQPGPVRLAGRRMTVVFDDPAGPVTATLRGPVTLTEDDIAARNDTVLVAYDPADPRRVTLVADGPHGRGALLAWGVGFAAILAAFLYREVLQ